MGKDNDYGTRNFGNMIIGNVQGNVIQRVSFGGVQTVTVNGKSFSGNVVEQRNGRTFVDGKDVTDEVGNGNGLQSQLIITVQGNVEKLKVEGNGSVTVAGDAGAVKTMSGSVEVAGRVTGNVESMSGSISCGPVAGSVKTMSGTIKRG